MQKLEELFNPQSIAIVGASEEEGKVGNSIAKNILGANENPEASGPDMAADAGKFQGEVFLVNPKHETLFGRKCYKSLNEIEGRVDLAIIVIPAKFVNTVIAEAANKVKNYVVISAGFGETGAEGMEKEKELRQIGTENGLNILGPNCLGFIVPAIKLNASFAGDLPEAGNIAFVTQSGALAVALMDMAEKQNLRFSSIISIGNKMQISETEMLEYLAADRNTKVIGMYLEGIKEGKKFIETAQKISKPIVILKAGKTERAQKAITSHTGALAGTDEVVNAVFEKTGILRAGNLEELVDLLGLISMTNAPENNLVAAITNAGGAGVLATDSFLNKEIELTELALETKNALREFLPKEASLENPVDLLGDARDDRYEKALEEIDKEKIGVVFCLLTPQNQTPVGKIANKIIEFREKTRKTVVAVFIGSKKIRDEARLLRIHGIPTFLHPEEAVVAVNKYYGWKNRLVTPLLSEIKSERKQKAFEIIDKARMERRGALYFGEAVEILKIYGIKSSPFWAENEPDKVVYPAAVKIDSVKILHKTDKQGLVLSLKNREELNEAARKIKNNFPGENVIIQPMRKIQTELILGVKRDAVFGPIIIFGIGGIYTEIFKLVDFLVPPAGKNEIERKLKNGKLSFLFKETRGQKAYDLKELSGILKNLSFLAQELSSIKELDINPLLVYNDGSEALTVDVKIMFKWFC